MVEKNRKRINEEAEVCKSHDLERFLKEKEAVERQIEAERRERELERADTAIAKVNAGITSQHMISD